jgi:hypothetical protein
MNEAGMGRIITVTKTMVLLYMSRRRTGIIFPALGDRIPQFSLVFVWFGISKLCRRGVLPYFF